MDEVLDTLRKIRNLSSRTYLKENDDTILSILENFYINHKDNLDIISKILLVEIDGKNHLLHLLAYNDGTKSLEYVLKNFPDAINKVNVKNTYNQTPLIIATFYSRYETLRMLIKHGALIDEQNSRGDTALHLAMEYVINPRITKLLLQNGADINLKNSYNKTPKNIAIYTANIYQNNPNAQENKKLLEDYQDLPH